MFPSVDRVAELARQIEVRSKAPRLIHEAKQAAARVRAAEDRAREAERRLAEEAPRRRKELEEADLAERKLKASVLTLAQNRATLGPGQNTEIEAAIDAAWKEIHSGRDAARAALTGLTQEANAARQELLATRDQYRNLRRELHAIDPGLAEPLAAEDRLVEGASGAFLDAQIQALDREIDDGAEHFGMLDPREQLAQLKVWIGKFRRLQDRLEADERAPVSDEDRGTLERIHPKLVAISKEHMPGYIAAFRREVRDDWDAYIARAEEEYKAAVEAVRHRKQRELQREELLERQKEQRRQAMDSARDALDELRAVIQSHDLPHEGMDAFRDAVARVISGLGADAPELIELVAPYRELIDGAREFRALRRHLDRVAADASAARERHDDLLPVTRGRRVLMIGGIAVEEVRRKLLKTFEFDELDWQNYDKPALLESLQQRVRNRGVDLVILLKGFISHQISNTFRPLCEQNDIPCVIVEQGYGLSQVAEALRRSLQPSG